jgi:DNA-binding transcriptional MerR regulator
VQVSFSSSFIEGQKEVAMPPIHSFTGPQVERLTGLSRRTLHYWEDTGVFKATYVDPTPHRPYRRIYTFGDLVALRTLATLRRAHRVPLDELRQVGALLARYREAPWSSMKFGVLNHHVVFPDPETGDFVIGNPLRQRIMPIDVEVVASEAEAAAARLAERRPEDIGKISRHRHVLHNAWVVAGTRVPTSAIWNFHEAGFDTTRILKAYPRLTEKDISAALAHEEERRAERVG